VYLELVLCPEECRNVDLDFVTTYATK